MSSIGSNDYDVTALDGGPPPVQHVGAVAGGLFVALRSPTGVRGPATTP